MMPQTACPLCRITLTEHSLPRHANSSRCQAGQIARARLVEGLRPVELKWQAKSDHVAEALRLFGYDVKLLPTRGRFKMVGLGNEAWTSPEGAALALLIEHAAKLLACSFPEAARRLHERSDLVGPFGTARLLGGDDDEGVLLTLLRPIDWVVGSDGKRRPRRS